MTYADELRDFFARVVGTPPVDELGIYREMYRVRFADALRTDYPRVLSTLGEEKFAILADLYRQTHPSEHPSLRHYGRHFSSFLATAEPERAWLSELAALEWARVEVFDDRDDEALSADELALLPPASLVTLRLQRIAALRIVTARHLVETTWQDANTDGAQPAQAGSALLVWRVLPNRVLHRRIDAGTKTWLHHLQRPATLQELCAEGGDAADVLVRRFQQLVYDGVVERAPCSEASLQVGEVTGST